jgi:hypothetical protein
MLMVKFSKNFNLESLRSNQKLILNIQMSKFFGLDFLKKSSNYCKICKKKSTFSVEARSSELNFLFTHKTEVIDN